MTSFDPTTYGPVFTELLVADQPCPLGPGTPNRAAHAALEAMTPEAAFAHAAFAHATVADAQMAALCCGGVWLLHNYLDTSHKISQRVKTTSGSYWHAIMHRREGDASNAKYWFGNVGDHPVFEPLAEAARDLATEMGAAGEAAYLADQSAWDAAAFVDLCAAAEQGRSDCEPLCREIQRREWELLFDDCYRRAIG